MLSLLFDEHMTTETDHRFAVLIVSYGFDINYSPVGFRFRFPLAENGRSRIQRVVDEHWPQMLDRLVSQVGNRLAADIGDGHADDERKDQRPDNQ